MAIPLSICILTKNEENNIKPCITALRSNFSDCENSYEIVLIDTGSTDSTVEIATSLGCNVYHFEWIDDFSAARNYAISVAKYDFILFVDADEILEDSNWPETFKLITTYPDYVGRFTRHNHCYSGNSQTITDDQVERLFNKNKYHYELPIHEQLTSNNHSVLTVYDVPLSFNHTGYIGTFDELKEKAERNNSLLFKELEKNPHDPYILYQIAQSYGLISDKKNKLLYYQKAYAQKPNPKYAYYPGLIISLGYSYIDNSMYEEAALLASENYDLLSDYADFLCFYGYLNLKINKIIDAIHYYSLALSSKKSSMLGTNTFIPHYNLACIYEACEAWDNALTHFSLANNHADTEPRYTKLNEMLINDSNSFYNKKISIILPIINQKDSDLTSLIDQLILQTIGFCHIELILVGNLKSIACAAHYEKEYENSIMLINIEKTLSQDELFSIAMQYTSGDYIMCTEDSIYQNIDYLRYMYSAATKEDVDFICTKTSIDSSEDFCININNPSEAEYIISNNIIKSPLKANLYSAKFIKENSLDYSKLSDNSSIKYAKKIGCCTCFS